LQAGAGLREQGRPHGTRTLRESARALVGRGLARKPPVAYERSACERSGATA
jgi:hypothetical protein